MIIIGIYALYYRRLTRATAGSTSMLVTSGTLSAFFSCGDMVITVIVDVVLLLRRRIDRQTNSGVTRYLVVGTYIWEPSSGAHTRHCRMVGGDGDGDGERERERSVCGEREKRERIKKKKLKCQTASSRSCVRVYACIL